MTCFSGKQFSQNMVLYTISTINKWGSISKVNVLMIAHVLSLPDLIYLSTSGMFVPSCDIRAYAL